MNLETKNLKAILTKLFEFNKTGFESQLTSKQKVILGVSSGKERARTFSGAGNTIDSAYYAARSKLLKHVKEAELSVKWIYAAFIVSETNMQIEEFYSELREEKVNYYRHGIALDENYQFAFLEQELNGAGLIDYKSDNGPVLHNHNITQFLRYQKKIDAKIKFEHEKIKKVIRFNTKSSFYDGETDECFNLYDKGWVKGIRVIEKLNEEQLRELTRLNGEYLKSTVKDDGRFIYGVFPVFDREIEAYNLVRHILSVIALINLYQLTDDESYVPAIDSTYNWVMENLKETRSGALVLVDFDNENEIRLGALGLALVMICVYADVFKGHEDLDKAVLIGKAIMDMQNEDGSFAHVLNWPDMEIKDAFRIVYYSGEACYGLMKLYALTKDEGILNAVKKAFDFFIDNNYEEYYDHWLSYATNELTKYEDDDRLLTFGMRNATIKIDFIIDRLTSWPTFMELLNAACGTIDNIKKAGKEDVLKEFPMDDFWNAVSVRLFRQLNGIYFPELAMFYRNPEKIKYGVFIRHHSFRIRDDDIAHHIIGYYNFIENVLPTYPGKTINRIWIGGELSLMEPDMESARH